MAATGLSMGTLALLTLLAATDAHAQTFYGYTVLGGGASSNQFASGPMGPTVAGGADVLIARRFGIEGEVGLDEFYYPTVSLDGVVQLQRRAVSRLVPFVRAGFTHTKGEYSVTYNGPNVGGGLILWLSPRAGLRAEYLHVVQSTIGNWTENHDLIRVGVSFR